MATMKAFTDLEQSKKLAEILPIESADMHYCLEQRDVATGYEIGTTPFIKAKRFEGKCNIVNVQPAWSLAALFSVLPIIYTNDKKEVCGPLHIDITDSETPFVLWYVNPLHKGGIVELQTKEYDNLVDACYEMIIKLHEQKLL